MRERTTLTTGPPSGGYNTPDRFGDDSRTSMPKSPRRHRDVGIVVMAYGDRQYHRQARNLALSLRRHASRMARALLTDNPACPAADLYDDVVALDPPPARDCRAKLHLDLLTPYRRTLFIDADCLVLQPLDGLLDRFAGQEFAVHGHNATDGYWYADIAETRRRADQPWLPKISSGLLYFEESERVRCLFSRARSLVAAYHEFGFATFAGGIADEPLLSLAMAENGLRATDLIDITASPIGISGPITIDVLTGRCSFDKRGRLVTPIIPHFGADFSSPRHLCGAHYRREALKLVLADRLGCGPARLLAGARYGTACLAFNAWVSVLGRAPGDVPQWPHLSVLADRPLKRRGVRH